MHATQLHRQRLHPSSSGRTVPVIDPSDGQPFDEISLATPDIDAAVDAASQCFNAVWSRTSAVERGRLLMKLSAKVAERANELAAIEQRDCGKPRTKQAKADATALARYFEFCNAAPATSCTATAQTLPGTATASSPGAGRAASPYIIPWKCRSGSSDEAWAARWRPAA